MHVGEPPGVAGVVRLSHRVFPSGHAHAMLHRHLPGAVISASRTLALRLSITNLVAPQDTRGLNPALPYRRPNCLPGLGRASVALAIVLFCNPPAAGSQSIENGRRAFEARCVGCHGSDGTGGGHGPAIVDVRQTRVATPAQLRDLIRKGIPEAGMPAFAIPDQEVDAIASFVEALKTPAADHPVVGDVARGEQIFKSECVTCHMVRGVGGVLGPD